MKKTSVKLPAASDSILSSGLSRRGFLATTAASASLLATSAFAGTDKFARDRDWTGEAPVTYPEPAWEVLDKRFTGRQGNATLQRIWHGKGHNAALWCEGPVWMGDWGCLLWSDIPNHRVLRWNEEDGHVSVFQTESGYSNGHTRDNQGRLIAMEHDTRRVRRREYDGTWTILCDSFDGKKLNAPNDAAVHPDGSIYFTDPGYGIMGPYEGHKAEFELPASRVYRIDPAGKVTVAAEGPMRRPNGLCFSPDFKKLYVADTGATDGSQYPANIVVFDVSGTTLKSPRIFADFAPGFTDGIRCDTDGNVWCSWGWGGMDTNGVRVHHPDGTLLAFLHTPEVISNLCFGGVKRNRLFMTGSTSIYAVYVNAVGHALT
ncbi:SMP-30/gluconolactonase/LRE family protein [Propionivibrio sp.]|uniref:SMP-30/gluconolactonase/LRE family protein n=1 Tax=Propionivibrio sp. TaxID=2212460 RepID=UPI00272EE518|nr:SMP-30/gluconolactonase/LRE family protein [Propionivibrio sp.]